MWKMDKKVVFLDVDGTMVNEKGEIPESAQYAVRTAQANGHRMVVCSGRSRFQIYDALLELGFSGIVGGAGAFVEDEGKEFYHAYIHRCRCLSGNRHSRKNSKEIQSSRHLIM